MLDCIEGEEEPAYTADDVTACITLLLEFMSTMESSEQTITTSTDHVDTLIVSLNTLNEECHNDLIAADEREEIRQFIEKVLLSAQVEMTMAVWPE